MLKNALGFLGGAKKSTAVLEKKPSQIADPLPTASVKFAAKPLEPTSQIVDGQVQVRMYPEDQAKSLADRYRDAYSGSQIIEFCNDSPSTENADLVINAAYKQVFGNAHLMDSERSHQAESQLRSGEITVCEFVRQLALSDHYRAVFWDKYPTATAIELNFKHLLGRAPNSQAEISEHIQILAEGGFEAEIDSYIYCEEYFRNFGDYQVPYIRGYMTQNSRNCVGFTHSFPLFASACASDKSTYGGLETKLNSSLMQDDPSPIPDIRPIPDSFSMELLQEPIPRIPKEMKAIAAELWKEIQLRPAPLDYS